METHPLGTRLLHASGDQDRQTDMKKLIVGFRNFAKAPKNIQARYIHIYLYFVLLEMFLKDTISEPLNLSKAVDFGEQICRK
jgi:hypothetical protein